MIKIDDYLVEITGESEQAVSEEFLKKSLMPLYDQFVEDEDCFYHAFHHYINEEGDFMDDYSDDEIKEIVRKYGAPDKFIVDISAGEIKRVVIECSLFQFYADVENMKLVEPNIEGV